MQFLGDRGGAVDEQVEAMCIFRGWAFTERVQGLNSSKIRGSSVKNLDSKDFTASEIVTGWNALWKRENGSEVRLQEGSWVFWISKLIIWCVNESLVHVLRFNFTAILLLSLDSEEWFKWFDIDLNAVL